MPTSVESKCQSLGCLKNWKYSEYGKYYCRMHYLEMKNQMDEIIQRRKEKAWLKSYRCVLTNYEN